MRLKVFDLIGNLNLENGKGGKCFFPSVKEHVPIAAFKKN